MSDTRKARERSLDEAVSRAVRDNLPPLQRSIEELQQALSDLVSACSSARPANALPAMLRAQATSAALTASLSVLSSFVSGAMQRREHELALEEITGDLRAVGVTLPPPERREHAPIPPSPTPMAARHKSVVEAEEEEAPEKAVE